MLTRSRLGSREPCAVLLLPLPVRISARDADPDGARFGGRLLFVCACACAGSERYGRGMARHASTDSGRLRRAEKNGAGFLRGEAFVTRTGVFKYRRPDGTISRQLRHPDDVFAKSHLDSIALAVLTLGHPPVGGNGLLTDKNARDHAVGGLGHVRRDGDFVAADFQVIDADAIAAIEAGVCELSLGYESEHDETPGFYQGEPYDLRQTNMICNHAAIVPSGRAGPEVRICLDSQDALCVEDMRYGANTETQNMKKIKLDGVDHEVSETAAQAIEVAIGKLSGEIVTLKSDGDKIKAKLDSANDEIAKLKKAASPEAIRDAAKKRADLVGKASKIIGAKFDAADKDDDAIKIEVIKHVSPSAKLDGASADYVAARFDAAVEIAAATKAEDDEIADDNAAVRAAAVNPKLDSADDKSAEAARKAMIERNRNAWQTKQDA